MSQREEPKYTVTVFVYRIPLHKSSTMGKIQYVYNYQLNTATQLIILYWTILQKLVMLWCLVQVASGLEQLLSECSVNGIEHDAKFNATKRFTLTCRTIVSMLWACCSIKLCASSRGHQNILEQVNCCQKPVSNNVQYFRLFMLQ